MVQLLRLVKALEVDRHLGALLSLVVQLLEVLNKLNALVISTAHKGLVRHGKVQALQCVLCQDAPQPRVTVVVHKGVRIIHACGLEQITSVPEAACLVHDHELCVRLVWLLHDVIQEHRGDLQVVEAAQVGGRGDRLLGVQASEDVHARLLHHGKQLGVIIRPPHVPRILALKRQMLPLSAAHSGLDRQVKEGEHAVNVNDAHLGEVAVEGQDVRPAAQHMLPFRREVRQVVALHHT
mmetsp:Transcript_8336/g.17824  ORF Transcript_8336/g.17824 Transcript_8336/m.17824 type:complete len:237 (+) Transcript_8336:2561-3271(+)